MIGKKRLKVISLLIVLCMVATLFVACGGGQKSEDESSTAQNSSQDKNSGGTKEKGEIEYVSMWKEGEPQGNWVKEVASDFEKETGIKVKLTLAGRDVLTKVKSRIIMQDPPDIIDQDLSELKAALLGDDVLATPINDLFYDEKGPEGQDKMMDIFSEKLIRLYERDGELYFFPYEYITSGFFYDKNMFKENGLTPPKTWSEFIDVNEKLKQKGIAPLTLDGNIAFYNAYYYYWACARVLGTGMFNKAVQDKTGATWDDPGYLKAAEMVYEISKSGKNHFQDGYEGSNFPAAQADWALGKSGSILCGSWIPVETMKQAKEGFEYGFYPFPEVEGGKGKVTDVEAYLIGCAIPKGAKNVEGAKDLLKFMVKKENAEKFVNETINMSSRKDVDFPEILADLKVTVENAESFHLSYDGVMAEYGEWFANVFYPLDNALVFGDITPSDFIKKIKENSIKYWSNKN